MRGYLYFLVYVALSQTGCARCGDIKLIKARDARCNTPCYGGPAENAGVGVCNMGKWICGADVDSMPVCEGWGDKQPVDCNGLDNDCDGQQDLLNNTKTCATACGSGTQTCPAGGAWSACTAPQPQQEICNGKDDDCDGLIDEPQDIPVSPCYSLGLDSPTLKFGECHVGISRCLAGQVVCYGEALPSPEICDGKDNNCDGQTDEGYIKAQDIVFIVDYSGSMDPWVQDLMKSVADWPARYASDNYHFALLAAPDDSHDEVVTLRTNFTGAAQFAAALPPTASSTTGGEPTYDALWLTADYASNPLALAWRANSIRTVFVFSDECDYPACSYATPVLTESDLANKYSTLLPEAIVYVFTDPGRYSDYSLITAASGGDEFDVTMSPLNLAAKLEELVAKSSCR